MEKKYELYKKNIGKYEINCADMTIDNRLPKGFECFTPIACQCKHPCRKKNIPTLEKLSESKIESIFLNLMAA